MTATMMFVAALYELFLQRQLDRFLERLSPDVEWIENVAPPDGGTFIGREAMRKRVLDRLVQEWDDFTITPDEIHDGGSYVVVDGSWTGTFKATGRLLRMPFCHVWKVREQQVVQLKHFTDTTLMDQVR